ncbi:MAG: cohesin domain-containing protein [Candidatus Pacebacteria bacterium]|nr:cohesin domain-containing protein [Candidatus Paceibacterota bacterium]
MKNKLLTIALMIMILAAPAFAATSISLSPETINVQEGQSFDVMVAVSSQENASDHTIKVELDYPADKLEVTSFNFVNNWTPLTQSGYDLIDNTNGVLIKTAKYPAGVSSTAVFGIVSFSAKKEGSGTIKMGNGSLVLDGNGQNVLSGAPAITFTISAAPVEEGTTLLAETTSPAQEEKQMTESPTAQAAATNLFNNPWLAGIIIAVVALTAYLVVKKRKKD